MSNKNKAPRIPKPKHPVSGLTEVQTKARLKAAILREWRRTTRYKHIKEVRYKNEDPDCRSIYAVDCAICGRSMGQSEKISYISKAGKSRRILVYAVDHVCETGMPPINDIVEDLGEYAIAALETPVRVVCIDCHADVTKAQMELRHASK